MKKFICIILAALIILGMTACASESELLEADIQELQMRKNTLSKEVRALETEKSKLQEEVTDAKVENGTAMYVLTINIRQTHFTLDINQHLKDSMNDISIQIPVTKEYYDSVNVGDVLDDSFRMGSFIFKGSFGSWNVTIKDKTIM